MNQKFLEELRHEAKVTEKMLERVPEEKFSWQPHEESMSLLALASHLVDVPGWIVPTLQLPELDFATTNFKSEMPTNTTELVEKHRRNVKMATEALQAATDAQLHQNWKMRNGEMLYFEMPRALVLRNTIFNHLYHHRGQLSVYLRLCGVSLPPVYGPTADESGL
ncbi:MAG: DinB family protein [Microscillaceae bacterium]